MSAATSEAIYDEIPYPNLCHAQTSPDRLAMIGRLLGMRPEPVEQCRVLELACAEGGNLAPLALMFPGSEFVGIDYSSTQIATAKRLAEGAGLKNVTFIDRDILDETKDLGKFNYIIAHGVYSWTPDRVRRRILTLCREQLTPNGIAFISFNALPGWAMLRTMREMILHRTRAITDPGERSITARQFINELAALLPDDQYFGFYVRHYAEELQRRWPKGGVDPLFLHDELEVENNQFYFHEFIEHLNAADLQYLSEAELSKNLLQDFGQERAKQIAEMSGGDFLEQEQLMDVVRNRTLRQALVVHKEIEFERRLQVDMELMAASFVSLRGRLASAGADAPANAVRLVGKSGANLATDHPVTVAAFNIALSSAPESIPFVELLQQARQLVGPEQANVDAGIDAQVLAANLIRGYTYDDNLVQLGTARLPLTIQIGERPVASPVARWEAAEGYEVVASLRHERVRLDPAMAQMLPLLDGSRTRAGLLAHFHHLVEKGVMSLSESSETPVDTLLEEMIETTLTWLARAGLLVAS